VFTGEDTVKRTRRWNLPTVGDAREEIIANGPTWHANRTLDNYQILFFSGYVTFLETFIGVTFVGSDKARPHLNTCCADLHKSMDVHAGIYAASGDNWNRQAVWSDIGGEAGEHLGEEFFQNKSGRIDLFRLESQMSTGHGAFHDERIRGPAKTRQPFFAQNDSGPGGRNDRHEFGLGPFGQVGRKIKGETRTRKNGINIFPDRRFNEVGEVGHGHHDIDAKRPWGSGAGRPDFSGERPIVGFNIV